MLFSIACAKPADAVVFVERSVEAESGAARNAIPATLGRPGAVAGPVDVAEFRVSGLDSQLANMSLGGATAASISFGLNLAGTIRGDQSASLKGARMLLGGSAAPRGMHHLESFASGSFEPLSGNLMELATFGSKTSGSPVSWLARTASSQGESFATWL